MSGTIRPGKRRHPHRISKNRPRKRASKSDYERFISNNFNIRYWSWNYRTRLAFQWILDKGLQFFSFQVEDLIDPLLLFFLTTSPCWDLVICAPAAFLGWGSRFSGSLSGIEHKFPVTC